jgi:T1SS-143 domain-containing protein
MLPTKVSALADGVLVQWADGFSVILVPETGSVSSLAQRVSDSIYNNGFAEEAILHPYMMWTAAWEDDPLDFALLPTDQPVTLQRVNWDGLARTSKPSNPPTIDDGSVAVSEEGLKTGQPDTIGNPSDSTNSSSTTGQLAVSDPDGDPVTVILGSPSETLTSQGVPIVWTGAGTHILQGSAGSVPVITVSITDSGAYTVTILGPIDHPDVMSEDILAFITPVTVTDSAGLTDTGTLTVTIEDDALAIGSVTTQTVDEEGLVGGNAGDSYSSGDATGEALTATASLNECANPTHPFLQGQQVVSSSEDRHILHAPSKVSDRQRPTIKHVACAGDPPLRIGSSR